MKTSNGVNDYNSKTSPKEKKLYQTLHTSGVIVLSS